MAKFPGGTPGRWDRIAVEIGRTVAEVSLSYLGSSAQKLDNTLALSNSTVQQLWLEGKDLITTKKILAVCTI